jgi:hypothetical protein
LRERSGILPLHRLFGVGKAVSNDCRIDWVIVVLDGIHDKYVSRSDLRQQDRDVCSVMTDTGAVAFRRWTSNCTRSMNPVGW